MFWFGMHFKFTKFMILSKTDCHGGVKKKAEEKYREEKISELPQREPVDLKSDKHTWNWLLMCKAKLLC